MKYIIEIACMCTLYFDHIYLSSSSYSFQSHSKFHVIFIAITHWV